MAYNGPGWRVSSARKRFPGNQPEPSTSVPRHDPNSYDRLRAEELQVAYAPDWEPGVFPQWNEPTTPWWLLQFAVVAFVVTAVVRVVGIYALHPLVVPFWAVAAIWGAATAFLGEHDAALALRRFALVAVAFVGVLLGSQARTDLAATAVVAALGAVATIVLIDLIGSHALAWRLRRLQVPIETAARWLKLWDHRFVPGTPAAAADDAEIAREIDRYAFHLSLIVGIFLLAFVPDALPFLLAVPVVALAIAASPAPRLPVAGLLFATATAVQSWTRYAPDGEHVLGRWRSPAGAQSYRLWMLGALLILLAFVLLPPRSYVQLLGAAAVLNSNAVWSLLLIAPLEALVPVVVLLAAITLALARLLWTVERLAPLPVRQS